MLEAYSDCLDPQAPPHLKVRFWCTHAPMPPCPCPQCNRLEVPKCISCLAWNLACWPHFSGPSQTVALQYPCLLYHVLQVQALRNLSDFAMVSEEKPKPDARQSSEDSRRSEQVTVAVAAGAGNTVTASGPIQRHWNRVLECLFNLHHDVQQTALKVWAYCSLAPAWLLLLFLFLPQVSDALGMASFHRSAKSSPPISLLALFASLFIFQCMCPFPAALCPLQLVEVALGQGIVFPVTCVGHLIALAAEASEAVRSTALRLVTLINARYAPPTPPAFVRIVTLSHSISSAFLHS